MERTTTQQKATSASSVLRTGVLIGLSGGLAEVVFVSAYSALTGHSALPVAQGVATAVGLGASAVTGVAVHMGLAVMLGLAVSVAWNALRRSQTSSAAAYGFMSAMLVGVWAFNFLVLLPQLSPAFLTLLPYPITFASKMLFALAGAPVLQRMGNQGERQLASRAGR